MPHKGEVRVVARLRLPDGREFDHVYWVEARYAAGQEFWWNEGNAACDCNRSLFINQDYGLSLGELDEEDEDALPCLPCGDTITLVSLTIGGENPISGVDAPS